VIETFLRRPHGPAEYTADAVRVLGLVSVVAAFVWWSATDAGVLALVLPGLLLPRFVGVQPVFDVVFGVTLLVAAWSNVFDLYTTVSWWDLVVHFVCTGVIAAMAYLLLARLGMLVPPQAPGFTLAAALVLTTCLGLAGSAVWEMVEWLGKTFISSEIFVAYDDTIGDMAVGGLGALVAGVALGTLPLHRRSETIHS
jgi:hypothetical protein